MTWRTTDEWDRDRPTSPLLTVTLARGTANAIDAATSRELSEVVTRFRDDDALRVAIVTGAGYRFFCGGWDLNAAAAGEPYDPDFGAGGSGATPSSPTCASR